MNKKISTPIALGIILILSVLLIIFTYWQITEIDKSTKQMVEIKVSDKKECKEENECILRDIVVNAPCSPCDISSSEYQCVSKEEARRIQEEQSEKYGTSPCSPCPPQEISDKRFKCICEENKCVKVEDETADWKTYRNEEYGFEIKYPHSWIVYVKYKMIHISNFSEEQITEMITKESLDENYNLLIVHCYNQKIEDWLSQQKISADKLGMDCHNEEIKIGSYNGYKNICSYADEKELYNKVLWNDNVTCSFENSLPPKCLSEECEIFNQMLSTFKFIREEAQLSPNTIANFVYLTDIKYDGNLGGRLGADEKCSSPAGLNCKPGTIHAFITVDSNDSIIKMDKNYNFDENLSIYWFNRDTKKAIILAENWYKMINEDIINDQKDGTGKGEWSGDFPWTGGKGNTGYLDSCNKWTTNEGDPSVGSGFHGIIGGTDKTYWLSSDGWAGISMVTVCANKRYLRCICEGSISQ